MAFSRLVCLALAWAVLLLVARAAAGAFDWLVDPRAAVFAIALPLLLVAASSAPRDLAEAFRDALRADCADLPAPRRERGAGVLRSLGGLSLAAGVVAMLGSAIGVLGEIAETAGQVTGSATGFLAARWGAMLVAPVYGLALKFFLYDPLAQALEAPAGVATELEDPDGGARP